MSDFILLQNKNTCPHCRVRRSFSSANCFSCGTRLFTNLNGSFHAFEEETGIRYWWAWSEVNGWMHRDHLMIPDKARKLVKRYEVPKLDANYGKQTTPEKVAAMTGKKSKAKVLA